MKWLAFLFIATLFTTSQATAKLEKDLVVYFTFDKVKDEKILDASGNDLDAEIVANVDFVEGKYGDAIHIAAEPEGGDCVRVPADDLLKIEGEITMMAWVYHANWGMASGQLFDNLNSVFFAQRNETYSLGLFDSPENLGFLPKIDDRFEGPDIQMVLGSLKFWRAFTTDGPMVDKSWHHIAGTYDGRTTRIYLDGEIFYDREENVEFMGTNDSDLRIGCAKNHPQYAFKNGSIDEAGLWRRALTRTEIKEAMKGFLAVSPKDKVATTWGDVKRRAVAD